jgi:hypothetical protein
VPLFTRRGALHSWSEKEFLAVSFFVLAQYVDAVALVPAAMVLAS